MTLRDPLTVFHRFDFDELNQKLDSFMRTLLKEAGAFGEPASADFGNLIHFSPFPPIPTEENFLSIFPRTQIGEYNEGHLGWFFIVDSQVERFAHNTARMPLKVQLHGAASFGREDIATNNDLSNYSSGYRQSREYILSTTRGILTKLQDNDLKFLLYNLIGGTLLAPEHAVAEYSWANLTFMYFYQTRISFDLELDLESRYSL